MISVALVLCAICTATASRWFLLPGLINQRVGGNEKETVFCLTERMVQRDFLFQIGRGWKRANYRNPLFSIQNAKRHCKIQLECVPYI